VFSKFGYEKAFMVYARKQADSEGHATAEGLLFVEREARQNRP
jgi:hypothetical protein